ncbi:MAG: GNAT family N-acetyltransferase [Acidimicrobiia bacterium]|nr:GNAT family N-acetyltransferase [Acidimicrobiia bacterium]MCY4456490.1 GNAT family N-acetyltransferase [Acidimicrobiaceae bacterium]
MTESTLVLEVPDLRDDLIYLRPWQNHDAPALAEAWQDPQIVASSIVPEKRSLSAAGDWIARAETRHQAGQALELVVAKLNSSELLGEVSLHSINIERRAAKMGWWLVAPARGQGIATRAVKLLSAWALESSLAVIIAEIKDANLNSEQLAERCGFKLLRPATPQNPAVYALRKSTGC